MQHKLVIEVPDGATIDPDNTTVTLTPEQARAWAKSILEATGPGKTQRDDATQRFIDSQRRINDKQRGRTTTRTATGGGADRAPPHGNIEHMSDVNWANLTTITETEEPVDAPEVHRPDIHRAAFHDGGVLHTFTGPNHDGTTRTWIVATRHPRNTAQTAR